MGTTLRNDKHGQFLSIRHKIGLYVVSLLALCIQCDMSYYHMVCKITSTWTIWDLVNNPLFYNIGDLLGH